MGVVHVECSAAQGQQGDSMTAFVEGGTLRCACVRERVGGCVCQMEPRGQPVRTSVFRE